MTNLQQVLSNDTSELLSTKLALPRWRPSLIQREALLTRLDVGLERKLILLSAPAGFGKTSLASEWAATRSAGPRRVSVAWLSLDSGDNDPVRFWRYLLTACRRFDEAVATPALGVMRQLQAQALSFEAPQQVSFEPVLTALLNELAQLESQNVLVLEDYHVITSPEIHEAMDFLLEHLPDSTHIMMLTRSDPPLPLARLRARNQTVELRAADLRFSLLETQTFLGDILPFTISDEVIARLQDRTEGWAAGLNLMALTLQGRHDSQEREHFLETFTGSYRHIVEYLVGDVLNAQSEPVQSFLLQTSGLSRLTGSLCDAVTGRGYGDEILEELERANLFLLPLDGTRQWYRYHALFAEAMLHEARRRLGEGALRACYARASAWYEENGLLTEAIESALSAQEFVKAAEIIDRLDGSRQFTELSELHTWVRWLGLIPDDVLGTHPDLCFVYAAALLFSGDRSAPSTGLLVEKPLEMAERGFRATGNRAKLGEMLAFRALLAWWQGGITQMIAYAREAVTILPQEETMWHSVGLGFLGAEEVFSGQLNRGRQKLMEARALSGNSNRHGLRAIILMLGHVCLEQGELRQAGEWLQEALIGAEEDQDLSDRGPTLRWVAQLSYEWNMLDAAERQAQEALEIGRELGDETVQVGATIVLAQVLHARGQSAQAQHILRSLTPHLSTEQSVLLHREALTCQARLSIADGDLAAAQRWAGTYGQYDQPFAIAQYVEEEIIVARLAVAQIEGRRALEMLASMLASSQRRAAFATHFRFRCLWLSRIGL